MKSCPAALVFTLFLLAPALAWAQAEPAVRPIAKPEPAILKPAGGDEPVASEPPAQKPKPRGKEAPEPVSVDAGPTTPVNPRQFRFVLLDGSQLSGELLLDQIEVATKYGPLSVPLADIQSFTPGLASHPELAKQFDALLERLGGDDFKAREQAQRELARLGPAIRRELEAHTNDENAERRRRVAELGLEINEQEEARGAFEESRAHEVAWIRPDTVVTAEFTSVGKISPTSMKVKSKYGEFTLSLADIRSAQREANVRPAYYKSVVVDGSNFAPSTFKESGFKLQKGDRVTVRAEGSLSLTNVTGDSNAAATADGDARLGWYIPNQIAGGALVARIGKDGRVFLLGKNKTFVAESAGELQLAIAVSPDYAQNEGIPLPGLYNVKLKIEAR